MASDKEPGAGRARSQLTAIGRVMNTTKQAIAAAQAAGNVRQVARLQSRLARQTQTRDSVGARGNYTGMVSIGRQIAGRQGGRVKLRGQGTRSTVQARVARQANPGQRQAKVTRQANKNRKLRG